jgi:hypothetical protein
MLLPAWESSTVPIRAYLGDASFSPDVVIAMSSACDDALKTLGINRSDAQAEIVARKIIEIARQGEHDPQRLADLAVSSRRRVRFDPPRFRCGPPFAQLIFVMVSSICP